MEKYLIVYPTNPKDSCQVRRGRNATMEDYGVQLTKEEKAKVDRICGRIRERVAKEAMTPRQRFEAVERGEEPDRIPIMVNALGLHAAAHYGLKPRDLYTDPKVALFAYLTHLDRFGYDTISTFRFSIGSEEFGGKMSSAEGAIPTLVGAAVETAADLGKIKFPNVHKDGTLPWMLWMISLLKEKLGDIMPIYGFTAIPGAINPILLPMNQGFLNLRKDPEFAHCVAALVMKFVIDYANAQFEAGADGVRLVGTDDQVSYKYHREFEFPYVCGFLKSVSGPCFLIGAGDWSHVLESYAEAGVEGFHLYGRGQPLEKAKEVSMKYNLTLRYGTNGMTILHGPPEKIRQHVKEVIQQGWPGCRFVLATESLDFSTPAENLDIFMEAAKEFGRLPLKF